MAEKEKFSQMLESEKPRPERDNELNQRRKGKTKLYQMSYAWLSVPNEMHTEHFHKLELSLMQLKNLPQVLKFHLSVQLPKYNSHFQLHSGGLLWRRQKYPALIMWRFWLITTKEKLFGHNETHLRRKILIAISWTSLFEVDPLLPSCSLITSASTFKR